MEYRWPKLVTPSGICPRNNPVSLSPHLCDLCRSYWDLSGVTCQTCITYYEAMNHHNLAYEMKHFDAMLEHAKSVARSHTHVGNGKPSGAFAFTLIKSPKDPLTVADMLKAVRKIMSQQSCPVKRYAWYYEDKGREENGDPIHPHIHGMYETVSGGRIEQKHFKRAWSIWSERPEDKIGDGFRGGYHRPVRSDEAYSDYIKKDGGMCESKD